MNSCRVIECRLQTSHTAQRAPEELLGYMQVLLGASKLTLSHTWVQGVQ